MSMKRRDFLKKATVGAGGAAALTACGGAETAAGGGAGAAASGPRVNWRMATSFPRSLDLIHGAGERITEQAALVAGVVYATSFEPTTELCGFGGHSWLYKMNFRNGGAADGDDDAGNDTTDNRTDDLGDGIASRPVVDVVNEKLIVQGSDTEIHVYDTVGVVQLLVIRSWRQRYN